MSVPYQITVGAGLTRPQGRRIEVADVGALAQALRDQPSVLEAWWAPHTWRKDIRDGDGWEGSCAVAVDVDRDDHAPLTSELAEELYALARAGSLPGSIYHRTPAGARLIFVFDETCTEPMTFERAAEGAAQAVVDQLAELDITGIKVDPKPHRDLARLYFTPNSIAKGVQRSAEVVVILAKPFSISTLIEFRHPDEPIPIRPNPSSSSVTRAMAYVAKMGGTAEGNRDNQGFRVAATLVNDFALAEDDAWLLLNTWNRTCSPPLEERDLRRLLRSAAKNGSHPPGQKLQEGAWSPRPSAQAAPPGSEPAPFSIPLIKAAEAVEKPVEWVIENFLAKGELTDLSGDPGVGKGGITASWAARVTSEDPEATVIFFATEDPLGRVKARLRAEGADLERVLLLDITRPDATVMLPAHTQAVEEMVRERKAALLILDPALEFMEAELDSHKQQDVARFMAPLLGIAQRTGAALLTVRHNNKNAGASALHRASGSIGFTGKVRIALLAAKDNETGKRALAVTKNNLGKDRHTVTYDIVSRDDASVVAWGEVLAVTADELVNQEPAKRRGRPPARLEAAVDVLHSILESRPMKVEDVIRCAKSEGVSRTTAYAAADALKVEKITLQMKAAWRLPGSGIPGRTQSDSD